jgi:hypothetical protein
MILKDGTGTGSTAHVNEAHMLRTFAVTENEQAHATEKGNSYNINTGTIALTGTSESALLYFKNGESPLNGNSDYVVVAIAVGMGTRSGNVSDSAAITIIAGPDTGDIISDATAVDMKSNANFGSNNTLSSNSLIYKGKDGGTISGGRDHALLYMTDGRLFAPLSIELPVGASVGVKIDLNTSGGANVYCALIGYRKDGELG